MAIVKWLHISDLHLNTDEVESVRMREQLPDFIRLNGYQCDYIFCTGDIRDSSKDHYAEPFPSGEYFKQLCSVCEIPVEQLFIVAGNHDVNRNAANRSNVVEQLLWKNRAAWKRNYKPENGFIDKESLQALHEGQAEFRCFLGDIYDDRRLEKYSNPERPHFTIETEHFNILHVDTTLSYSEKQQDQLIVGTKALQQALKDLNEEKPTIALSHYALNMLEQEEQRMVSNMLRDKYINLWLAGHEHYHELRPFGYVHSIQAGELKMEERCASTILFGAVDTETGQGEVKAFSWFSPMGWAEHPLIWRGFTNSGAVGNKYPFVLTTSVNEGKSPLAVAAEQANQKYSDKLPKQMLDGFFADVVYQNQKYCGKNPLLPIVDNGTDCILLGDGGTGKTTMFLDACKKLTEMGRIAFYIPLEQIESFDETIENTMKQDLFQGNLDAMNNVIENAREQNRIILFLDGMNEVFSERRIVTEIKKISNRNNIQCIVSSRSNFAIRYGMHNFHIAQIQLLREEQLQTVFSHDEWKTIKSKHTLLQLLRNPMMAAMYKQIYPVMEQHRDKRFLPWITEISCATQMLINYYLSQMAVLLNRVSIDGEKLVKAYFSIAAALPYIAYLCESKNHLYISIDEFSDAINNVHFDCSGKIVAELQREYRLRKIPDILEFDIEDYLIMEAGLLKRVGDRIYFPHQIYRDYLAAGYIANYTTTENVDSLWNQRKFTYAVSAHLRELANNRWCPIAQLVADDAKGVMEDKYLQVLNLVMTYDCEDADYSNLDLTDIRLLHQGDGNICLKDALISNYSIGCEESLPIDYLALRFSEDNRWLIGFKPNEITIWDVENGEEISQLKFQGQPRGICFIDNLLLLSVNVSQCSGLYVFGFIDGNRKRNAFVKKIFNKRLREMQIEDNQICCYYNNRIQKYNISNGKQTLNVDTHRAYLDVPMGRTIVLEEGIFKNNGRNEIMFSKTVSKDKQLYAECYRDGRFHICYFGGEILHTLDVKRTAILDAAISDNGLHAVTVSYEVYCGKRKIQLWDLENHRKVEERLCTENTKSVHLVETGEWILGTEEDRVWCWNWNNQNNFYYLDAELVSNQYKKFTSYGNKILRRNQKQTVELFDLDNQTMIPVLNPRKGIKLAVIMPNNKLAIVAKKARYVIFNSMRDDRELKVNSQESKILGLYSFRQEPFIAVATNDNIVSMYHTGTGQRTRILESKSGCRVITGHPKKMAIGCAGRGNKITVFRYFTWDGGKKGNWYPAFPKFPVSGNILDLAFNPNNEELIAISSTGQIYYMSDLFCDYRNQTQVINGFNVSAYDFSGVKCDENVRNQLIENGARASQSC